MRQSHTRKIFQFLENYIIDEDILCYATVK